MFNLLLAESINKITFKLFMFCSLFFTFVIWRINYWSYIFASFQHPSNFDLHEILYYWATSMMFGVPSSAALTGLILFLNWIRKRRNFLVLFLFIAIASSCIFWRTQNWMVCIERDTWCEPKFEIPLAIQLTVSSLFGLLIGGLAVGLTLLVAWVWRLSTRRN